MTQPYVPARNQWDQPEYSDDRTSTEVAKDEAAGVKDTAVEQGQHVASVAQEQAGAVKDTALDQGQQVAGVAKEQASRVAAEASSRAKDLLAEGLDEVRTQAGSQQKRLAQGLHSLAGELGAMASGSQDSGPLTDLAHRASAKGGEAAHWLENAQPSEVLDSLRSFAARRPVVFLAAATAAGVVVGRLTRGLVADAKHDSAPARAAVTRPVDAPAFAPSLNTPDYGSTPGSFSTPDYASTPAFDAPRSYDLNDAPVSYGSTGTGEVTR